MSKKTSKTDTNLPRALKSLWDSTHRCLQEFDVACVQIDAQQAVLFPREEDYLYPVRFDHDSTKELKKAVRAIFDRLIRNAERNFAPTEDSRLELPTEELTERWVDPVLKSKKWEKFDPVAIWADLERRYGNGHGHELAYQQAAEGIRWLFFLRKDMEWVERAAGVVIDHSVTVEGVFGGGKRLAFYSQRDMHQGLMHFKSFLEWADERECAAALQRFINHYGSMSAHDATVNSREKWLLGDKLSVTTYYNRFEYLLSRSLAEQLQVFIGTFAPNAGKLA